MVSLDADHAGEILAFLADYHTFIREAYRQDELDAEEAMEVLYLLGNIEGRCLYNGLIQADLDILEGWENNLNDWKNDHGGISS